MIVSFPGKTFLIGEYAVLDLAPAVLVNTLPRFEFHVDFDSSSLKHPFHKDSLAARWMKKHHKLFSNVSISCLDPHQGKGGFGLSGAEFNCAYLIYSQKNGVAFQDIQLNEMWEQYRLLEKGKQVVPGGADILSQWVGGICLFDSKPFSVRSLTWPFWHLKFALIRTGYTLKTWEHLKNLKQHSFPELKECAYRAFKAIESFNDEVFLESINQYSSILNKNGLTAQTTMNLLEKLRRNKDILSAKGCGAMGAEIIVVFFRSDKEKSIMEFLADYDIVSISSLLTYGVSIK